MFAFFFLFVLVLFCLLVGCFLGVFFFFPEKEWRKTIPDRTFYTKFMEFFKS